VSGRLAALAASLLLAVHCAAGVSTDDAGVGAGSGGGSGGGHEAGSNQPDTGTGSSSGGGSSSSSSGAPSDAAGETDDEDATDAPSSDSGGCGTRGGMRGQSTRTLMVGSATRTYVAYLPQSASPGTPLPFVYVFHGANQTGSDLFQMTQYSALADSEGIAVVFPDGQGVSSVTGTTALDPWNVSDNGALVCGAGAFANNPDAVDFAFMDAIAADVAQDQCLDTAHTFVTGFSMGGYFTHHVACDRANIKAAAPHSGGTIASLGDCTSGHVPIIIFHGTADPLIAAGCDDPNSSAQNGFPPSATLWAQKNGCQTTYTTMANSGSGGGDGQCYLYDGCPAGGQVELCTFTGMGHAWAGAADCPSCIGSGATYASATQLEWSFFKTYAW
jgi:polyhydroxybutyrate depolymerase